MSRPGTSRPVPRAALVGRRHLPAVLALAAALSGLASQASADPTVPAAAGARTGTVVAIGGALSDDNVAIWSRLVQAAGGAGAPWVVIGTASGDPLRAARRDAALLQRYGARAEPLPLERAADADDPALAARVRAARGVFLSGGDQSRLTAVLRRDGQGRTAVLQALHDVLAQGGVVAGTSAGAAVASHRMFTGGDPVQVLRSGAAPVLAPGLGLLHEDVLVDQHFLARGRLGRLLPALVPSSPPSPAPSSSLAWGLGVEEDSAALVQGHTVEAIGRTGVLAVDVRQARGAPAGEPWRVEGVRLTWMAPGDRLDLRRDHFTPEARREAHPVSWATPPRPAAPVTAPGAAPLPLLAPGGVMAALQAVARPAALDVQGEVVPPGDAATSTDGTAQWRFVLSRSVDTRGWAADGRFSLHGVTLAVQPLAPPAAASPPAALSSGRP
jgi:cyanophycinase